MGMFISLLTCGCCCLWDIFYVGGVLKEGHPRHHNKGKIKSKPKSQCYCCTRLKLLIYCYIPPGHNVGLLRESIVKLEMENRTQLHWNFISKCTITLFQISCSLTWNQYIWEPLPCTSRACLPLVVNMCPTVQLRDLDTEIWWWIHVIDFFFIMKNY